MKKENSDNSFTGELRPHFSTLTNLRFLDLSNNQVEPPPLLLLPSPLPPPSPPLPLSPALLLVQR
jgi:hypothetical protein